MALSLAMMALIEPGDEVLYPDPGFPIYPSLRAASAPTPFPFFWKRKINFSLTCAKSPPKFRRAPKSSSLFPE